MTGKIYFQWQNKYLRDTIYPARDMKLRHFLLYYWEIDLWAEIQGRNIEDLANEKAEYEAAQRKAASAAYKEETAKRNYFCTELPATDSVGGDENLERLRKMLVRLHADFQTNFEKFRKRYGNDEPARDRKEKIFVALRILEWEQHCRDLRQTIVRKRNFLNAMENRSPRKKEKQQEFENLEETVLPRMEMELRRLRQFVAAQNRLEKRKAEFEKRQKELLERERELLAELALPRKQIETWEIEKRILVRTVVRLTQRPTVQFILTRILESDVYQRIDSLLSTSNLPVDRRVRETILSTVRAAIGDTNNEFDANLKQLVQPWLDRGGTTDADWILQSLEHQSARFLQAQRKLKNVVAALAAGLKSMQSGSDEWLCRKAVVDILDDGAMLEILGEMVQHLEDLRFAIGDSRKGDLAIKSELSTAKTRSHEITESITEKKREWYQVERELEEVQEALHTTRDLFLTKFILDPSVDIKKEIVLFQAQQYDQALAQKDHDQLLQLVFDRFYREPDRFPLWLQYMVIHFSGMRYASAHGSWADPRDMLLSLRTLDCQKQFRKRWTDSPDDVGLSDEQMQAECEAKADYYESLTDGSMGARSMSGLSPFARAAAADPGKNGRENPARKRLQEYYIPRLGNLNPDTRRKAFLDLTIEEENYKIREMKQEDVLSELKEYRDDIPSWMWVEIVKLTDLRLTEVDSAEWETLTPEQQKERLSNKDREMGKYREIMNEWKAKNLTGWRQEHDRSNRLIVTRAVCNEVAEHIQHLRGHDGASGLTQKPLWYVREERGYYETRERPPGPRPYFVRAKNRNDFEIGASILWPRFVFDSPNEWRIAKPMSTRAGDDLIDRKYLGRQLESGGWVYRPDDEPISRVRVKIISPQKGSKSKTGPKETEYLRWMHEATVATVAETADGTVVLTFETNLPYEDPSISTIGVFKRYLKDLVHDQGEDAYNPAFVGFVPEAKLPTRDLEEMLDWNHILMQEVLTPAQLESYRRTYIRNRKPPSPTIQMAEIEDRPMPVKAFLKLPDYELWIDELAAANPNLYRVKKWGQLRDGDLDVITVGTTNFQAVGLYNKETGFGAVSNFIYIMRDDIDHLMSLQINDEFVARRKNWLLQKMMWLCKFRGTIYFYEQRGDSWRHSQKIRWGTVALGGNLVYVEAFENIKVKGKKDPVPMARLAGFRKHHWSEPLDDLLARGLVHRCFCAYKNNQFGDTPKGIVYSPFYSLLDWDFAGLKQPRALYIPCRDLVRKPDSPPEFFDERRKPKKKG